MNAPTYGIRGDKMSLGFFQRGLKQKIPVVYPLILAGKVLLLPEWEQNNPY